MSQLDRQFEEAWKSQEGKLATMARKFAFAIPGHDVEDIVAEFKVEVYSKLKWWDSSRMSLTSYIWMLSKLKRADLVAWGNTQGRDFKREDQRKSVSTTASDTGFGETDVDPFAIVPIDEFHAEIAAAIGNAGRFSLVMNLETVDRIGKIVLFCLATGFNINETCYHVRKSVGPNPDGSEFWFHRKEFNAVRRSLRANPEVRALMA